MKSKLHIAVAGAGMIGRRHIDLVRSSRACSLSAIADPAPAALEIARQAGVPLYPAVEDLLAAERLDGVILATPNQLHVQNALDCIKAGVAALIEKPVAHTVEEGVRLCKAAESAGAKLLVGHHRRHSPIMARAREIVRAGVLGRIVAVQGSAMYYKPDGYFGEAPWRCQPGGGPILINLIHEVDNMRMLCGDIEAVQAFSSNTVRGFQVEDTAAITLRFASGALGTFLLSDSVVSAKSWEQTSRENTSYATCPDEDCYVVAGTKGSLGVPTMRLKTYATDEDRSWWKPFQTTVVDVSRADPLERQLDHFCALIRGEVQPVVTVQDGLQNVRIIDAISESARTGRVVNLAPCARGDRTL